MDIDLTSDGGEWRIVAVIKDANHVALTDFIVDAVNRYNQKSDLAIGA